MLFVKATALTTCTELWVFGGKPYSIHGEHTHMMITHANTHKFYTDTPIIADHSRPVTTVIAVTGH